MREKKFKMPLKKKKITQSVDLRATAQTVIRFNDCDPLGIVWHGNYMAYFEDSREAFSKKFNLDFHHFYYLGYTVPLVHVSSDFKRTLSFRDVIDIEARYIFTDAAKIIFEYTITKADTKELVCTGQTIQVFIDKKSNELCLVYPDCMLEWIKQWNPSFLI